MILSELMNEKNVDLDRFVIKIRMTKSSKKCEIEESNSEEKIGIRYMDFPQGHVGK